MNIHQEILAKSEQNGHVCLYQHLKNVADTARVMAKHLGFDEQIAVEGALLHDIGKVSPVFQQSLISRCNMWMLLIVKLLSFKRYNYPFYKCRENEQQM